MGEPGGASTEQSGVVPGELAWVLDGLASVGDGLVVADASGRLVYRNAAAVRLVGPRELGAERSRWSSDHGVFHVDEVTPFPSAELPLVRALAGEVVRDVELFIRNSDVPDGLHILTSASPLRDERGAVRGAVAIIHDDTQHRDREVRLALAERQKQAILDNIPDIAWLKDGGGRFVIVNRRLAEAAGKTHASEVVGLTDLDLFPRELAERYRTDDAEIMRTGAHLRVEEPFVDGEGRTRWIETFKTRILGDRGEIIGTTGIARDITARKRAEESLRLTNDELEKRVRERTAELAATQEELVRKERLAVLGQLAGGVAHQIRNPLAAIMNATYVLRRHLAPDQHPNVDDALRIIHDEVKHANVIITSLLDFARVRTPDRHPTALVELLERVVAAETIPASVRVERHIEDVPLLALDVNQMHGALSNVVRNALDAMPDGGVLRLEVRRREEQILVAITDTGSGISPQVRGHLFEPLHSTKPAGIGLGLVTARTFVEAHGGRILSAPVATGARFELWLPVT